MFNVLIVEDSTVKLKEIYDCLESIDIGYENIDHVVDSISAKKKLREKNYDLMVLDIALPPRKDKEINLEEGIVLLEEIVSRPKNYRLPTHIVGLTEKEDVFDKAKALMDKKSISLFRYSVSELEWKESLIEAISLWLSSKNSIGESITKLDYYDVAIICALEEELLANINNGWDWKIKDVKEDDTIYYSTEVNIEGNSHKIIACRASRMGMPATTAITTKVAVQFKPKLIIMNGIMAGIKGRVNLGDIIVFDPVWDWGSGKWKKEEELNQSLFMSDPHQFALDSSLKKEVNLLKENKEYLFKIRNEYGNNKPSNDINVFIGPVASGASVLSDSKIIERIKEQHRKLLGIEMEGYGVYSAVEVAIKPKPLAVCIKSVVDFGDQTKSDDYHGFGVFISAIFTKGLLEKVFKINMLV